MPSTKTPLSVPVENPAHGEQSFTRHAWGSRRRSFIASVNITRWGTPPRKGVVIASQSTTNQSSSPSLVRRRSILASSAFWVVVAQSKTMHALDQTYTSPPRPCPSHDELHRGGGSDKERYGAFHNLNPESIHPLSESPAVHPSSASAMAESLLDCWRKWDGV